MNIHDKTVRVQNNFPSPQAPKQAMEAYEAGVRGSVPGWVL